MQFLKLFILLACLYFIAILPSATIAIHPLRKCICGYSNSYYYNSNSYQPVIALSAQADRLTLIAYSPAARAHRL